jgi:predicted deacylase
MGNVRDFDYDFKKITILSSINNHGIVHNTRTIPKTSTNDLNRALNSVKEIDYEREVLEHIKNNDIIIDVHSSPKCTNFVLLNQNETTNSYVDFCTTTNIKYLIRYSASNTIKKYCLDLNKISFTLELNQLDYVDNKSAVDGKEIILDIINRSTSFVVKNEEPVHPTYVEAQTYLCGIFIPTRAAGELIIAGNVIGHVIDVDTFKSTEILSKYDGHIIAYSDTSYVNGNRSICLIQPLNEINNEEFKL